MAVHASYLRRLADQFAALPRHKLGAFLIHDEAGRRSLDGVPVNVVLWGQLTPIGEKTPDVEVLIVCGWARESDAPAQAGRAWCELADQAMRALPEALLPLEVAVYDPSNGAALWALLLRHRLADTGHVKVRSGLVQVIDLARASEQVLSTLADGEVGFNDSPRTLPPTRTGSRKREWSKKDLARGKFALSLCEKNGLTWRQRLNRFNTEAGRRGWERVETENGVKHVAREYRRRVEEAN